MPNIPILSRLFGKSPKEEVVNAPRKNVRRKSKALPVHEEGKSSSSSSQSKARKPRKKKVLGETNGNPGSNPSADTPGNRV
jgi:hypothetical protein